MRSAHEAGTATHATPDALPADARALFGTGLGDSLAWYETVLSAALPSGAEPAFLVIGAPARMVFPMLRLPRGARSLTTPYTILWAPLGAPGEDAMEQAGHALGAWCRRFATVRLDALDPADPRWPKLLAGIRRAGMRALPFDHFGNWHADIGGLGWDAYLAARPGALREILRRRGAHLHAAGAVLRVVEGGTELSAGIAAYEEVYGKSWKDAEPFPAFNATLMQSCAAAGTLRLGLLQQGAATLAAQIWVAHGGTATVLKLAHDEAHRATSPGTVLTGMMIRHLMEHDRVTSLDFGRGDDAYKRDWTDTRRPRGGLLLANPRRAGGLAALVRAAVGRRSSFLKKRTKKLLSFGCGGRRAR